MPGKKVITEEYLLHCGRCDKLSGIKQLSLSNHDITELDTDLMSRLTSVNTLDLSRNQLTCLPVTFKSKSLRVLDLSENHLTSVEFVKNFVKLRELYIGDNEHLCVEDKYIAAALCPGLEVVDEDENIHSPVSMYRATLQHQIEAIWDALYAEVYNSGICDSEVDRLHQDFIHAINKSKTVGSNLSMHKLKKFMIELLTREVLDSVRAGKYKMGTTNVIKSPHREELSPYSRCYGTRMSCGTTPVKDYSSGTPQDKSTPNTTASGRPLRHTPSKMGAENQVSSKSHRKSLSGTPSGATPKRRPSIKETKGSHHKFTVLKRRAEDPEKARLPPLPDYDPIHVLRCHSADNKMSDSNTKVWKCAFEPRVGAHGIWESTNTLASCGGQIVCLVDCMTGKVMKRYKDSSDEESFYCLAWTILPKDGDKLKDDISVLAVAGQSGTIKLLQPSQLVMYAVMTGHLDYISCLKFHPKEPTILFSGARDQRIIMWNIGIPDLKNCTTKFRQLAVVHVPDTDALSMQISVSCDLLIVGCEESCYGWRIEKLKKGSSKEKKPDIELVHPADCDNDEQEEQTTVDGVVLLPNDCIVTKCVGHSCLYLWDLKQYIPSSTGNKTKSLSVKPMALLDYKKLDVDYVFPDASGGIMAIGDDSGNVNLYNLSSVTKKKKNSDEILLPSRILNWPSLTLGENLGEPMKDILEEKEIVVNCVALSSDQRFVVCGTDNNLLCVWKKES